MSESSEDQQEFLERMKGGAWLSLLENIPSVCFFLKNSQGQYMGANRAYARYLGVSEKSELIGKTDFDFHPEEVSRAYVENDQKVMQSGESVIDFVEPWSTVDGRFGWTITSKHPVYDGGGKAIGVVGVTQPSEGDSTLEKSFVGDDVLLPDESEDSRAKLQVGFLSQMKNQKGTRALFENLPRVLFYIKNRECQFIAANRSLLSRLGLASESEIVGASDCDFFPAELADQFEKDDRQVLETASPIYGRVEQYYNEQRILDWYVTTKLPIFGSEGQVIGLMGVYRVCEETIASAPALDSGLSKVTELIRNHPDRRVGSEEMAAAAGMSEWQLRRRFRKSFGMTPHDFERASRIQAACQALVETDASLAEIALDFGFCDQSAFSVQFKRLMGCSPKQYRIRQK